MLHSAVILCLLLQRNEEYDRSKMAAAFLVSSSQCGVYVYYVYGSTGQRVRSRHFAAVRGCVDSAPKASWLDEFCGCELNRTNNNRFVLVW
ncbi:hypothetical protein AALO_G00278670 [Alosa alosa]|uniref:Secreted protein n=1 Tax=Alosa alosa TaxID=278164 RepID=A0AAV6FQV2_9TELE|nr:hypothetical protein AALO_G00278670 [Alosa alosa]